MATTMHQPSIGSNLKDGLNQAKSTANSIKSDVKDTAANLKSELKDAAPEVSDQLESIGSMVQKQYSAVKDGAKEYISTSESFIKKYPFATVLGAVAVGAVFASVCWGGKKGRA